MSSLEGLWCPVADISLTDAIRENYQIYPAQSLYIAPCQTGLCLTPKSEILMLKFVLLNFDL